ncbi:hypothetical protein UB46_12010 [Burkholderiaceae bacterium 16]|nr:hypothetical protein UB46_12010 [Burkholderiaceae bacterium 16]
MIRAGRPAYNSAILATGDEQLLQNIVRTRFYDSVGFLTVASVTANVSVTASATVQAGFGPASNYAGNLVPFAGMLTTEQNPTISYAPLAGDELLRHLGAETTMERTFLMLNSAATPEQVWNMIVRRINNLRNPDFPDPPLLIVDPRFEQVVATASLLQRRGVLYWVQLAGSQSGYGLVIHSYSPDNTREVAKLLSLLGVKSPVLAGDDITIPVQLSVGSPDPGSIAIETRSLFDMIRIAGATIDLASDTSGVARQPAPGPAAGDLRIRSGSAPPADARVATQYRGRWYYIDGDDQLSKQWFTVLQLLAGAPAGVSSAAPVLTIPVTGRR